MPRGYWRIIAATVGLIVLGALGYASYQLYNSGQQQRTSYHYQPARYPRHVILVPSQTQPKGYQPDCDNPQGNSNADLCAQWAAIDQVMESNRLASVNVRLSLFVSLLTLLGTVFVGWTLLETRNTARRELRAYINVTSARIKQFTIGEKPRVVLKFKNSGATPAQNTRIVATCFWDTADEAESRIPNPELSNGESMSPIGAGEEKSLSYIFDYTVDETLWEGVHSEAIAIYVSGTIYFTDVFGRSWETRFRLVQNVSVPNWRMIYCAKGNEAT